MAYADKVIEIYKNEESIDTGKIIKIRKRPKLRKDGQPKLTQNHKKKGVKTGSEPFHSLEDIKAVVDYFTEHGMYMDRMAFYFGLFQGRRIGDILELKWSDIFNSDLSFKNEIVINEQKTDKESCLIIHEALKDEIQFYIENYGVKLDTEKLNEYVFMQMRGRGRGKVISQRAYEKHIKEAEKNLDFSYPITTHSVRRTFGNWQKRIHPGDSNCLKIIQKMFKHANIDLTYKYCGFDKEEEVNYYNDIGNLWKEAIIDGKKFPINNCPVVQVHVNTLSEMFRMVYEDGAKYKGDPSHIFDTIQAALELVYQE